MSEGLLVPGTTAGEYVIERFLDRGGGGAVDAGASPVDAPPRRGQDPPRQAGGVIPQMVVVVRPRKPGPDPPAPPQHRRDSQRDWRAPRPAALLRDGVRGGHLAQSPDQVRGLFTPGQLPPSSSRCARRSRPRTPRASSIATSRPATSPSRRAARASLRSSASSISGIAKPIGPVHGGSGITSAGRQIQRFTVMAPEQLLSATSTCARCLRAGRPALPHALTGKLPFWAAPARYLSASTWRSPRLARASTWPSCAGAGRHRPPLPGKAARAAVPDVEILAALRVLPWNRMATCRRRRRDTMAPGSASASDSDAYRRRGPR